MNESKELKKMIAYMALHQRLGSQGNGDFATAIRDYGEDKPLPFPLKKVKGPSGEEIEEYEIPIESKERVLSYLYPFDPVPNLEDLLYDLHEDQIFEVKNFIVIRDHNVNFLVSPFFKHSGGSVLDWLPPVEKE